MSSIYWWLFQYLSHKAVKILFGLDYFPWHKILFIYILVSEQSQDFIFVVDRFSSDFKKLSLWPRPPPLLNDPCHWPELPECGTKGILKRPPLSFNSRVVPHGTWIPFMSSNIFLNVTFNSSLLKKCPKLMTLELIFSFSVMLSKGTPTVWSWGNWKNSQVLAVTGRGGNAILNPLCPLFLKEASNWFWIKHCSGAKKVLMKKSNRVEMKKVAPQPVTLIRELL